MREWIIFNAETTTIRFIIGFWASLTERNGANGYSADLILNRFPLPPGIDWTKLSLTISSM